MAGGGLSGRRIAVRGASVRLAAARTAHALYTPRHAGRCRRDGGTDQGRDVCEEDCLARHRGDRPHRPDRPHRSDRPGDDRPHGRPLPPRPQHRHSRGADAAPEHRSRPRTGHRGLARGTRRLLQHRPARRGARDRGGVSRGGRAVCLPAASRAAAHRGRCPTGRAAGCAGGPGGARHRAAGRGGGADRPRHRPEHGDDGRPAPSSRM